jgi:hypothetical protein
MISFIIGFFEYIDPVNRKEKLESKRRNRKNKSQAKTSSTKKNADITLIQKLDQEEQARVVAAISIALATALNTRVDRLKVKEIRRL